jgi:hypothetical protein
MMASSLIAPDEQGRVDEPPFYGGLHAHVPPRGRRALEGPPPLRQVMA